MICLCTMFDTQRFIFYHGLWVKQIYLWLTTYFLDMTVCCCMCISWHFKGMQCFGNMGKQQVTPSHARRAESSAMLLWEPLILQYVLLFRCLDCSTLWHMQQEHISCMSSGREQEPTTRREPQVCSECIGLLTVWLGHYCEAKQNTVHDPKF